MDQVHFPAEIAVILPAYNEELTIAPCIEAFHRALPRARIVVVDNNSADRTAAIAEQTLLRLGARGEVLHEPRQGKGNAVRRAFLDVDADVYLLADADLTYPAERALDLIAPIVENRADMTVGDRLSGGDYRRENKRHFHGFGNQLVKWLVNKFFAARLADIMSGYRAFSRRFVLSYPLLVEGFQLETDVTLHALDKRLRIIEIPIEYKDRPQGSVSKLNTLTDGARVLFAIAHVLRYYRPLFFFSAIAGLAGLLGLVAALPVFADWLNYQYIYHLPLAVLASALELLAAMALGIGFVLDSIAHQDKMRFDKDLLAISHQEKTQPERAVSAAARWRAR